MSFVEFYNEQLFDLFLSPDTCSSRNQRRFNVFGGNGNDSGVVGKRNTFVSSALKPKEFSGSGGNPPQQAPELAIYERPDGCTHVKVNQGLEVRVSMVARLRSVPHCAGKLHAAFVWGCFACLWR